MVLGVALVLGGLIMTGLGLSVHRSGLTLAAPIGWVLFLSGVVRLVVPDFF